MLIIRGDGIIQRHAAKIRGLSEGDARKVFVPAINRGGDQVRTKVKRSLVKSTGIKYGKINQAVKTIRATRSALRYQLEARGEETNLNLFGAKQGKRGVSARPWAARRVFKSSFIVPAYGGRVFIRTSDERYPLKPLFGPNLAREMMRDPAINYWREAEGLIEARVIHEMRRLFNI